MLGALSLVLSILTALSFRGYVRVGAPSGPWWLLTGISLYVLPQMLDLGFARSWGRRSPALILLLMIVAGVLDLVVYGNVWGPPLGALLYALAIVVFGFMGVSFVLAGVAAVPGCEMGALPSMLAQFAGGNTEKHH